MKPTTACLSSSLGSCPLRHTWSKQPSSPSLRDRRRRSPAWFCRISSGHGILKRKGYRHTVPDRRIRLTFFKPRPANSVGHSLLSRLPTQMTIFIFPMPKINAILAGFGTIFKLLILLAHSHPSTTNRSTARFSCANDTLKSSIASCTAPVHCMAGKHHASFMPQGHSSHLLFSTSSISWISVNHPFAISMS